MTINRSLLMAATFTGTVACSVGPAQAVTTITLSPNNAALPASPETNVIQGFEVENSSGSVFMPNTTNSAGTESVTLTPRLGIVDTSESAILGLSGEYLQIGRRATYTISFLSNPIAFFSFAFNVTNQVNGSLTLGATDALTLEFADNSSEVLLGAAILGSPTVIPGFGRVSYAVASGPQITSVSIMNRGGQPFRIDDIAVAVPEPAAWLLMILGFGIVGSALRRRRTQVHLNFA